MRHVNFHDMNANILTFKPLLGNCLSLSKKMHDLKALYKGIARFKCRSTPFPVGYLPPPKIVRSVVSLYDLKLIKASMT